MKRIIAGPNAVTEAILQSPNDISVIYMADTLKPSTAKRIEEMAKQNRVGFDTLPKTALDALCKDLNHQSVVAITGAYSYLDFDGLRSHAQKQETPLLVVLDQVQDPGNLGAIVRSAFALGACGLILTKDRSASMTPAAVRASAGASERLKIARVTNLARCLDVLKKDGYYVYGAAGEAQYPISKVQWPEKTVLVMGNEGRGLRRLTKEHCDDLFHIPMAKDFDSLNVSAAAAIALYEASPISRTK